MDVRSALVDLTEIALSDLRLLDDALVASSLVYVERVTVDPEMPVNADQPGSGPPAQRHSPWDE